MRNAEGVFTEIEKTVYLNQPAPLAELNPEIHQAILHEAEHRHS
jgi:hypothetical protein